MSFFSDLTDEELNELSKNIKEETKKKSLYSAVKAEITPEMEKNSPYATALAKTAQQGIATPALNYLNMAGGGIPEIVANKLGYEIPKPENLPSKILTGGADIAGFVQGLPMKAGKMAVSKIPEGAKFTSKVALDALRGAGEFGVASALTTPPEEDFKNWKARLGRGIIGAGAGGVVGGVGSAIGQIGNLLTQDTTLKTGREIKKAYTTLKNKMSPWFGRRLKQIQEANPEAKVDLSKTFGDVFKGILNDKKKYQTLVNKTPRLRTAMGKGSLSLQETEDLINQMNETMSQAKLAGRGITPSDAEVKQLIKSVKDARNKVFPQMKNVDAAYGKVTNDLKSSQKLAENFKSTKNALDMFKDDEQRRLLKNVMPEDLYNQISRIARSKSIGKEGYRLAEYGIRYVIIYNLIRNVINSADFGGDSSQSTSSVGE